MLHGESCVSPLRRGVSMVLRGSARLLSQPACSTSPPVFLLGFVVGCIGRKDLVMTLSGVGADGGLLLCGSVHGCCVIWCYASPGLSFRWCLVLGLCDLLVGPIGLIVGVSCLLCSSALPGVWSFLRVTTCTCGRILVYV